MAQTVRITYYGIEGEGRTMKEAKMDASRKVEKALEGDYTPQIIGNLASYAVLLWREPKAGWSYRVLTPDSTGRLYGTTMGFIGRQEAEDYARRHVADLLHDKAWISAHDHAGLREWDSKNEFQTKYQEARSKGHSDQEAHAIACGFPHLARVAV